MDKKLKILILEDVTTDAELMEQELSKEQFEFVSNIVSTEEDFLKALKKFKPDLILSDYSLPQFDGLAALEIAKKLAPMTPFIIVTGKLNEETAVDCIKAGALDYVIKEHLVRLGSAVKNALKLKKEKLERKNAQEALRKSEQKYRSLVENINEVIFSVDANGIVTFISPVIETLSGFNTSEVMGQAFTKFVHQEDLPDLMESFQKTLAGNIEPHEYRVRTKSRTYKWLRSYSKPIYKGKRLIGLQGVLTDITERKKAEDDLRNSEKKYKSLYSMVRLMCDNVPDMIWAKDMEKKFIFANKAICKNLLNAKDTDEPIGKNDIFFASRERESHPGDPEYHSFGEICRDSDEVVMENKKPERFDEFGNVKSKFLFLDVYKAPFWDEQGNMIGTVGCARDVTREKKVEQTLSENEERFRALSEATFEALFISDKGICLEANQSASDMFGYTHDELIGIFGTDVIAEESKALVKKNMLAGYEEPYEAIAQRKDGTKFPAEFHGRMFEYKGKIVRLTAVRDITERKLAEEKIQKELREKEILLKEIHHRVKNNLQVICSLLLLQSRYIKDKKALDMFQESQDRVRSMALVHEKLYKSKDLSSIDFADYVKSLVNTIYRSYHINPEKIKRKINIKSVNLSITMAVPCGLLINEIISNSLKYAFPKSYTGKAEIKIKLAPKGEKNVVLTIEDNGIGLPQEFDVEKADSLGMRLIKVLGKDQLSGKIKLDTTKGTKYEFIFQK